MADSISSRVGLPGPEALFPYQEDQAGTIGEGPWGAMNAGVENANAARRQALVQDYLGQVHGLNSQLLNLQQQDLANTHREHMVEQLRQLNTQLLPAAGDALANLIGSDPSATEAGAVNAAGLDALKTRGGYIRDVGEGFNAGTQGGLRLPQGSLFDMNVPFRGATAEVPTSTTNSNIIANGTTATQQTVGPDKDPLMGSIVHKSVNPGIDIYSGRPLANGVSPDTGQSGNSSPGGGSSSTPDIDPQMDTAKSLATSQGIQNVQKYNGAIVGSRQTQNGLQKYVYQNGSWVPLTKKAK